MTKLSPALPKADANGINVIGRSLISEPHRMHVLVTIVDCKSLKTDFDAGDVIPTARIRRLEVVLARDHELCELIMRRAMENRTGQAELDFGVEDELKAAFDGIDLRTGEVHRRRTDSTK